MTKSGLREQAIKLRKQGRTYSEILKEIPVARSTLSLWLRSVGLAKKQEQRLTKKKLQAARRGGLARRQQRNERAAKTKAIARAQVGKISNRELWLIGIALYWAEGAKEKPWRSSEQVRFGNSDPVMIKLFLKWLTNIIKIPKEDIAFRIYLHENHRHRENEVRNHWSHVVKSDMTKTSIYWKRHNPKTNRHNIGRETYFGLLEVRVKRSSDFNRRIAGWIEGMAQ